MSRKPWERKRIIQTPSATALNANALNTPLPSNTPMNSSANSNARAIATNSVHEAARAATSTPPAVGAATTAAAPPPPPTPSSGARTASGGHSPPTTGARSLHTHNAAADDDDVAWGGSSTPLRDNGDRRGAPSPSLLSSTPLQSLAHHDAYGAYGAPSYASSPYAVSSLSSPYYGNIGSPYGGGVGYGGAMSFGGGFGGVGGGAADGASSVPPRPPPRGVVDKVQSGIQTVGYFTEFIAHFATLVDASWRALQMSAASMSTLSGALGDVLKAVTLARLLASMRDFLPRGFWQRRRQRDVGAAAAAAATRAAEPALRLRSFADEFVAHERAESRWAMATGLVCLMLIVAPQATRFRLLARRCAQRLRNAHRAVLHQLQDAAAYEQEDSVDNDVDGDDNVNGMDSFHSDSQALLDDEASCFEDEHSDDTAASAEQRNNYSDDELVSDHDDYHNEDEFSDESYYDEV